MTLHLKTGKNSYIKLIPTTPTAKRAEKFLLRLIKEQEKIAREERKKLAKRQKEVGKRTRKEAKEFLDNLSAKLGLPSNQDLCSCGDPEDQAILGGPSPSCPVHGASGKKEFERKLKTRRRKNARQVARSVR